MELVYDTEEVVLYYYKKSEQFFDLANYLNVCKFYLECPIKDTIDAGPFPPTDENYKIFSDMTNLDEDELSIELNPNPFNPITTDENYEIFFENINPNKIIDIKNEESEDFKRTETDHLYFEISFEYIKQGKMIIENINFDDYKSFAILSDLCLTISVLYGEANIERYILPYISTIERIDTIAHLATCKAYELIGYWKAKMEEKRRNYLNTLPKTLQRKSIEEAIKDLLKKNNYIPTKKFVLEAQKITDRGERTIKNILRSKNITKYIKNNINK